MRKVKASDEIKNLALKAHTEICEIFIQNTKDDSNEAFELYCSLIAQTLINDLTNWKLEEYK